jgi:hypothetical protein
MAIFLKDLRGVFPKSNNGVFMGQIMAISGKRQEMDSKLTCSHSISSHLLYRYIY